MNIIVVVDNNWGIGYQNRLLARIPEDMNFFKEKTMDKVVIMGKNTLESFKDGKPLKNRINIVIALENEYEVENAVVVHSIEDALETAKQYPSEDVFVIGGASIYSQMLTYCDMVYVTKIDSVFNADTFFPNLDESEEWVLLEESQSRECNDLTFCFTRYGKKNT